MKRKSHVGGRPIHPMVVGFPIALFAATIGLELAQLGTHDAFYYRAAMVANIAGVMMALLAILPGAIDRFSLAVRSPAHGTGTTHALFMALTVVLFAISGVLLFRGFTSHPLDAHVPLAFGMVGIVTMTYAAALSYAPARELRSRELGAA